MIAFSQKNALFFSRKRSGGEEVKGRLDLFSLQKLIPFLWTEASLTNYKN